MAKRFFEQTKDPDRPVRFERDYVPLSQISENLVNAVVVSEDGLFMYHRGFDVHQMKLAYVESKKGRRERGGSTISQQTAKNCFLPHKHSMVRKAVEAYYTSLIELVWSKKRIMECYLNIIEFGNHRLTIIETPGHSRGSIFFYCEDEKVCFSGDSLFEGTIGRTDLMGGSMFMLIQSLRTIVQLPDETVVWPGHGQQTTIGKEVATNMYLER